jgi:hypothetical protein
MPTLKPAATRVSLTTSYIIKVVNAAGTLVDIGTIQNINPTENREMTPSFEIGTTQGQKVGEPFEIVPGLVRDKTLEVSRLRLYKSNIFEAFGAGTGVGTLYQQDRPLEIHEVRKQPVFQSDGTPDYAADPQEITLKIYKDVWFQRYGSVRNIAGGDIREIESATLVYGTSDIPA